MKFKEHTIDFSKVSDKDLKNIYRTLSNHDFDPDKISLNYINEDLDMFLDVTYDKEDVKRIKEEAESRFSEDIFELL